MRQRNLPVLILQHIGEGALQHTGRSAAKTDGMFAEFSPAPAGFNADQAHVSVCDELVEGADGIRAAAYAGNNGSWQAAFLFEDLLFHLDADAAMEVTHHGRVRMRTQRAAQQIISGSHV